ncbi:hypothetical protein TSTA_109060 [Talaromyces stipitatus ATCC 10500]|uniref:Uncharacterized protein n=1 Tax=Talaromyces stipitatus (strain ATCC 10500 / CBS 375.48 / QM 6759 / NRRL 1006) TaxID=441959 RepID=B8MUQ8_TALSN|nr:uncharacterized protein TSTA_109060 [Talaromyces stipitatus ATCC 10500]EED11725.1 hypothetical protein TSTA_109060 [Talaromyces stipitatus ATCC 10500]
MSTKAVLITDQLEKPESDSSHYRVLLVCNLNTAKASASVNVKAGTFNDKGLPGMAHPNSIP